MSELISDAELKHLQKLAKIAIPDEETAKVKHDLNNVLSHFAVLQEVDTSGLEEMARPIDLSNVLREDQAEEGMPQSEALALAIESEEGFFKVPRIVD